MKNYNSKLKITRTRHFCLSLHIAMQNGLYLHPTEHSGLGVWRLVSEGSCKTERRS